MPFPRRPRPLAAVTVALVALATAAPAHACSLRPPWEYRHAERLEFIGTPMRDTVFAGPGAQTFTEAPGHFGRGTARAIYGQRVRVDRLGATARRLLPAGVREVLLVPWDYSADCTTVPWSRSAGWLPDTLDGVFAAHLRPREHWAGDLPTLDITPFMQPYRDPPADTTVRDGLPRPRLTTTQLLDLLDRLAADGPPRDSLAALTLAARLRDDPVLAGRYPATEFLREALGAVTAARVRALRVPVAGTWRLDVTLNGGAPRTLFVRTAARPMSAYAPPREPSDTALAPLEPPYYDLLASAAPTVNRLSPTCSVRDGVTTAYLYMRWHGPPRGDARGEWAGDFDPRLFPALLDDAERSAWQARVQAANAAVIDSMRRARESGVRPPPPAPYVQPFRMRFTSGGDGRLRVAGARDVAQLGAVRVRGVRVSEETLACGG